MFWPLDIKASAEPWFIHQRLVEFVTVSGIKYNHSHSHAAAASLALPGSNAHARQYYNRWLTRWFRLPGTDCKCAIPWLPPHRLQRRQSDTKADSMFAPSQWETSLQSNAVSHWLGANQESTLKILQLTTTWKCYLAKFKWMNINQQNSLLLRLISDHDRYIQKTSQGRFQYNIDIWYYRHKKANLSIRRSYHYAVS